MSISQEIKDIDSSSAASAGIFFFSLLGPGVLTIFLFNRELFISLDTIKLVILSLSISVPGVILPIFMSSIVSMVLAAMVNSDKAVYGSGKEWFYRHGFGNAINMYLLLFLSFAFSWHALTFFWVFLASIILMCIFEGRYLFKRARNPEKYPPMPLP
jgi:hypothetical protein